MALNVHALSLGHASNCCFPTCMHYNNIIINMIIYLHACMHDIYFVYRDCLKFCFSHLIQKDLYQFIREWNCHRIRHNTAAHAVNGHPNELYFMPQLQGSSSSWHCDV